MKGCPRGLTSPPKEPCSLGERGECPWDIREEKHMFCYWHLHENGIPDPKTYKEIGELLGTTGAAIQQKFKYRIMKKLKKLLKE